MYCEKRQALLSEVDLFELRKRLTITSHDLDLWEKHIRFRLHLIFHKRAQGAQESTESAAV